MSDEKKIEEMMRQIVTALVNQTDSVTVESVDQGGSFVINVHVAPDDIGKVIGRQGRVVKSLRTLARAASTYTGGRHVEVEIIE
ncbi:MAG: KH domain-containing protein [Coriobacteriales bacterium]|jgi:predicted RNA-binding protein YlqC (UPF0109 family)|nr:KH domain-containing protein [Coriobacteriales bacterium]